MAKDRDEVLEEFKQLIRGRMTILAKGKDGVLEEFKQLIHDIGTEVTRSAVAPALAQEVDRWRADILPASSSLQQCSEAICQESRSLASLIIEHSQRTSLSAEKLHKLLEMVVNSSDIEQRMSEVISYADQLAGSSREFGGYSRQMIQRIEEWSLRAEEAAQLAKSSAKAYGELSSGLSEATSQLNEMQKSTEVAMGQIGSDVHSIGQAVGTEVGSIGNQLSRFSEDWVLSSATIVNHLNEISENDAMASKKIMKNGKTLFWMIFLGIAMNALSLGLFFWIWSGR